MQVKYITSHIGILVMSVYGISEQYADLVMQKSASLEANEMAKRYKLTQFALWLAAEIDALGITKQKFCDESGIAMGMLFRYYTAQQHPKITTYIKICKTLAKHNKASPERYVIAGINKIIIDIERDIK
jgi:predicted transcriptional regulator